jgi:hypothetical protein
MLERLYRRVYILLRGRRIGCWQLSSIVVGHDLNILDERATDAVGGHHMTGFEDEDCIPRCQLSAL